MLETNILKLPVADFATHLEAMTVEEVFAAMTKLEALSEDVAAGERADVLARIELVEVEIEKRFPGQLLAPYREWKKSDPLV